MNLKAISINVGRALLVSALFMFLSMIVSVLDGMDSAFGALSISFIITFIFGAFPFIFVRNSPAISIKDGFLIMVLSWVLSFIFGMLPYVLWGGEFSLVNAWFESVSGFTTTGSTILTDVEALPKSLLFWRSSTHFIGGLGVVVFMLLVLPDSSPFRLKLTNIEVSSLSREGYRFRSMRLVYVIVSVYVGMMVVLTLLLKLAGMSLFDAVNHAFSTVATGGFSTRNLSIAHYGSVTIDIIIMVFMVLSALHFGLIFAVFAKRSLKPMNNPVVKYFLGGILVMSVLLTFSMKFQSGYDSWGEAVLGAVFLVTSYVTTTGFGLVDNNSLPLLGVAVLIFASIQCGCSGSTSGGLKADRLLMFFKAVDHQVRKRLHPSSVSQIRVGGHYINDDSAMSVMVFIALYFFVIFASVLILSFSGVSPTEAFSGTIASIGNVGPGIGDIGAMGNYASQPLLAKLIYTVDMFLGRLEIFPILVVAAMLFKRER